MLRREGLSSSHLTSREAARGRRVEGLGEQRGRRAVDHPTRRSRELTRGLEALRGRADEDEEVMEIQRKHVSAMEECWRRQRDKEHRAMIAATVEELAPLIGPGRRTGAEHVAGDDLPPPQAAETNHTGRGRRLSGAVSGRARAGARSAPLGPVRRHLARGDLADALDEAPTLLDPHDYGSSPPPRRRPRAARSTHPPALREAGAARRATDELWSWDVSKLKGPVKWTYYSCT